MVGRTRGARSEEPPPRRRAAAERRFGGRCCEAPRLAAVNSTRSETTATTARPSHPPHAHTPSVPLRRSSASPCMRASRWGCRFRKRGPAADFTTRAQDAHGAPFPSAADGILRAAELLSPCVRPEWRGARASRFGPDRVWPLIPGPAACNPSPNPTPNPGSQAQGACGAARCGLPNGLRRAGQLVQASHFTERPGRTPCGLDPCSLALALCSGLAACMNLPFGPSQAQVARCAARWGVPVATGARASCSNRGISRIRMACASVARNRCSFRLGLG